MPGIRHSTMQWRTTTMSLGSGLPILTVGKQMTRCSIRTGRGRMMALLDFGLALYRRVLDGGIVGRLGFATTLGWAQLWGPLTGPRGERTGTNERTSRTPPVPGCPWHNNFPVYGWASCVCLHLSASHLKPIFLPFPGVPAS